MTTYEKQQRIESVNGIIKIRWFIGIIIVGLGFILKVKYFGWASGFQGDSVSGYLKLGALGLIAFGYNFIFWIFMRWLTRKPLEKISDKILNIMSILQIVPDQLMFTVVYYNTGTVDSMSFVFYFISVFLASSIYKSRGIILTGALAGFLYTTLLIIEFEGLIPHFNTYQGVTLFGSPYVTRGKIVTFIFYIGIMTFAAVFLSNLIRNREKKLRQQRDQLHEKTELLTKQTSKLQTQTQKLQVAKMDLEGEKNKVEAVIKSLTDGLVLLDDESKIVLINKVAKRFFNIGNEEEILGKKIEQIQIPEIRQLNQVLSSKPGQIIKAEMALPKPSNRILEISTADVLEADRRFIGKIIVLHDVTREKAIDKIKSDFVSITAHQLRTPLTAIKWVFDILLAGDTGKISHEQQEIINKGNKSNDRVIMLIDDLLEVARIEEGRFNYKFVKIPFSEMLDQTLKKFSRMIEEKKIKVGIIKPANFDPVIKADQEKMELALFNLIENALRYTPDNGTVDITISPNPENKMLNFEIKDSGIGIPKDNYDRIFSKFFRGENAVKTETEGSGLGLFIVKNIIESHGGKIWFESQEGVGTTFYFSLPLADK